MPTDDYKPVHGDVARWLRDRLVTGGGNQVGEFSASTVPTADEVTAMIPDALDEIAVQIGADIPAGIARNAAKKLVAIETAMNIEISFFSKQLNAEKMAALKAKRDEFRKVVDTESDKARAAEGDTSSDPGEGTVMPLSTIPQNAGGLIGWGSQF